MSYATQARPYALAAYSLADKNNTVEAWWQSLLAFQQALSFTQMQKFLANPIIALEKKLETIESVCREWMTQDFKRFLRVLAENNRLLIIDDICTIFLQTKEEAAKKVRAVLTTAFELDEAEQNTLVGSISQNTGLSLIPEFLVDPEIIGGAIIRFDGNVIDISIRHQLAQLQQNLIR